MSGKKILFDFNWDVDKYKSNYDAEYWELCRNFMLIHKTKYPEQRLVSLTEAFFQISVYGSSYDPKTTRMVSALAVDVLDEFLKLHPGAMRHPFKESALISDVIDITDDSSSKEDKDQSKSKQSSSIWDVNVDKSIIAKVLAQPKLKELLKGFVIIYDVRKASTMNDNKVSILEESFRRSKFGPIHWYKEETKNSSHPFYVAVKWKDIKLAEAEGPDERTLRQRLAQAVLSKIAKFSHGIEAKWSYYRDGKMPYLFEHPDPKKSNIYKIMPRTQLKTMAEITSYIDTFANSDSNAEIIFGLEYNMKEKSQIIEYIDKTWSTKLTHRTLATSKSKGPSHVCMYHIRSGEELQRWLERSGGENERYRIVPSGEHRRAGPCDSNVQEVLKFNSAMEKDSSRKEDEKVKEEAMRKSREESKEEPNKQKAAAVASIDNKDKSVSKSDEATADDLEKFFGGFVLFYDAKKNSEINKDDWFSALIESFKLSKFGPLEVVSEYIRPLRMRCILKWNDMILASAEGLTETQAKTAATLQLIAKLEPFTYIIQAKEEYFFGGKVPPFIENPDPSKSDVYRVVRRTDLTSYYTIFQTIDEFEKNPCPGEIVFGVDFTWELKNEIVVYLKAKGLDYRYFTIGDQKPWTHMAVYHSIKPEDLKNLLLECGGENEKYKLIPPQKNEPISYKSAETVTPKVSENVFKIPALPIAVEKPKQPLKEPPPVEEPEGNKIQIKLKTFKKDKVDHPEDTGGDFPGLILWVGIRKNSTCQKHPFWVLLESFKMSKFGELSIEESEETVWNRKEPMRKCVIKCNRKVLAVGMGASKNEAKNSASHQVLRQLRKHCFMIQMLGKKTNLERVPDTASIAYQYPAQIQMQLLHPELIPAKGSYFKEGKATPYDFVPDPTKNHVYRLVKKTWFKDRASIVKYVDKFSVKVNSEEVIFGDDFTNDDREAVLAHARLVNLGFRIMKCQSTFKGMHTHVAIFHQRPPPLVKAVLVKNGGEDDRYRLIPPGGKIVIEGSQDDMWPDTIENKEPAQNPALPSFPSAGQPNVTNGQLQFASHQALDTPANMSEFVPYTPASENPQINRNAPAIPSLMSLSFPNQNINSEKTYNDLSNTHPMSNNQGPLHSVPFGPQPHPMNYNLLNPQELPIQVLPGHPLPYQNLPLAFGPLAQPVVYVPPQPENIGFSFAQQQVPHDPMMMQTEAVIPKEGDLRDELARKRKAENLRKETTDRKTIVYDLHERKVTQNNEGEADSWSRKVFVAEPGADSTSQGGTTNQIVSANSSERPQDLRDKLTQKDRDRRMQSEERVHHDVVHQRLSPGRDRRRLSPGKEHNRISPTRNQRRDRFARRSEESRFIENRDDPHERIVFHDSMDDLPRNRNEWRSRSRSPRRSPVPFRDEESYNTGPVVHFRELWNNISPEQSESMFMYKYVKPDSTTESDPFSLLRAVRSLFFNVDFEFIQNQISIDEWQVSVELATDNSSLHPLVGEGVGATMQEAKLMAAYHTVDTVQKACKVIEPNFFYFAGGGSPEFIIRKHPLKTAVYEIIQNMDPNTPLDRYTVELIFGMFMASELEDLFFLATDFSYLERVLVIEVANHMNLYWRLFGPRHPEATPDDLVSTQHVCVFKQKSALQLVQELFANGGSTEKYTLVDPRESRITQSGQWPLRGR